MHAQLGPSFEAMTLGDRPLPQHQAPARVADAWAADFSEKEAEAWYLIPLSKSSSTPPLTSAEWHARPTLLMPNAAAAAAAGMGCPYRAAEFNPEQMGHMEWIREFRQQSERPAGTIILPPPREGRRPMEEPPPNL
jgi:hypothetical protein